MEPNIEDYLKGLEKCRLRLQKVVDAPDTVPVAALLTEVAYVAGYLSAAESYLEVKPDRKEITNA